MVKLTLPPSTNMVYRHTVIKGRAVTYKTKEAKLWQAYCKDRIADYLSEDWHKDHEVGLQLTMHLKHDRDIDSSLKVLLDALEGVLYKNDRQIKELLVKKIKDNENPCIYLSWYNSAKLEKS